MRSEDSGEPEMTHATVAGGGESLPPMTADSLLGAGIGPKAMSATSVDVASGPNIPGFVILGSLGEGGMGVVWRARQTSTNREVALKVMSARTFGSAKALRRFEREVELAAMLEHPNIARVYDSGHQGNLHYYALELIEGIPLDQYVNEHRLGQRQILELLHRVCTGVEAAHRQGVIHRDLKPSNILVSSDGVPHILDFGLAKSMDSSLVQSMMTIEGEVAGTPAFMAPEQAAGHVKEIDTRTDVYALGVILFRLLTGRSPHDLSGSHLDVLRRITDEEVLRPRTASRELDADLEAILLRALARHRDERYPTAGDLADDLSRYLGGDPVSARHATLIYFLRKRVRKHKWAVTAALTVLLALVGGAMFYVISLGAEQQRTLKAKQLADANAETARQHEKEARDNEARATLQAQRAMTAEGLAVAETKAARWSLYISMIGLANARLSEGDLRDARELLDRCPPEFRGWEYHHLRSRTVDQTQRLIGHDQHVRTVLPSADGSIIATMDATNKICIFDGHTGSLIRSSNRWKNIHGLALSPDGSRLAVGQPDGQIHLWDHATDKVLHSFSKSEPFATVLNWSPDGVWLAGGASDGSIALWGTGDQQPQLTLTGGRDGVRSISFRPDSGTIIVGFGVKEVEIIEWSLPGGELLRRLGRQYGGHGYTSVSYSQDGSTIVAMDNGHVNVFDASTGQLRTHRVAPGESGYYIRINRDGTRLMSSGWDMNARVFDLLSDQTVIIHRDAGDRSTVTSDGSRLISAGGISQPLVLPTQPDAGFIEFQSASTASLSPDGRQVALHYDDPAQQRLMIRIHDVATGKMLRQQLFPWREYGTTVHLDKDTLFAWAPNGQVIAYRTDDGQELYRKQFSPAAGRRMHPTKPWLVLWGADQRPMLHDLASVKATPFDGTFDDGALQGLRLSHDGRWMASADKQGNLLVWDVEGHKLLKSIPASLKNLHAAVPSPDGQYVVTSEYRGFMRLWHVDSGKEIASAKDVGTIEAMAFSPDGRRLFTVGWSQQLRIWEGRTLRSVLSLDCGDIPAKIIQVSQDGTTLVTGVDGGHYGSHVRLWHAPPAITPSENAIDLLSLVDHRLDTTRGQWQQQNGTIESLLPDQRSLITVPLQIDGSYKLRSRFTCLEKYDSVEFILPVARKQIVLTIGGWPRTHRGSGISKIRGQDAPQNQTFVPNHQLKAGETYNIEAVVRVQDEEVQIEVMLNGHPLTQWRGAISDLSIHNDLHSSRPKTPGLMTFCRARFEEVQLTMIDGHVTLLRSPTPKPPARFQPVTSPGPLNLLEHLHVPAQGTDRKWVKDDKGLRTYHWSGITLVPTTITPMGSYRLRGQFTRWATEGRKTVGIVLPAGAGRTLLTFDHVDASAHGLDQLSEKGIGLDNKSRNPTYVYGPLKSGKRYTFEAVVRLRGQHASITVHLDGKQIIDWYGPQTELNTFPIWDASAHDQSLVLSTHADVTYHNLDLEILDGQAWVLKPVKEGK